MGTPNGGGNSPTLHFWHSEWMGGGKHSLSLGFHSLLLGTLNGGMLPQSLSLFTLGILNGGENALSVSLVLYSWMEGELPHSTLLNGGNIPSVILTVHSWTI